MFGNPILQEIDITRTQQISKQYPFKILDTTTIRCDAGFMSKVNDVILHVADVDEVVVDRYIREYVNKFIDRINSAPEKNHDLQTTSTQFNPKDYVDMLMRYSARSKTLVIVIKTNRDIPIDEPAYKSPAEPETT